MKSPLRIQFDTKEDVGLLVYDYRAEDRDYSGGISNADGSLLPGDSENMVVWNREELESTADAAGAVDTVPRHNGIRNAQL